MDHVLIQNLLSWGALTGAAFSIWRLFDRIRQSAIAMTNIKRDIQDLQRSQARQEGEDNEIKESLKAISTVLNDMSERITRIETQLTYLEHK